MTGSKVALLLIVPMAMAACARQEPPPPPAPVMSPAEQACVAQGAAIAAVDQTEVTITPTSSTKVGDTIYTVVANGIAYNCVATPDGVVTSFEPQ